VRGYRLDGRGSNLGRSKIFLYSICRPTQPPIQWVTGFFPPVYSGRGVKLTTDLHLVPRSRIVGLYLHSPMYIHDLVLNYLSTGTTSPFLGDVNAVLS
jgi:hypothetical protein